jgi:hypothetical protein
VNGVTSLRLYNIYNLRLNANLMVLSAFQTPWDKKSRMRD